MKGTPFPPPASGGHGGAGIPRGQCAAREAVGLGWGEARRRRGGTRPPALTTRCRAQAVPQRRRGRHGAGHLPAPPPLPPGPGPANQCVSLTRGPITRVEGALRPTRETVCGRNQYKVQGQRPTTSQLQGSGETESGSGEAKARAKPDQVTKRKKDCGRKCLPVKLLGAGRGRTLRWRRPQVPGGAAHVGERSCGVACEAASAPFPSV